MLLFRGPDRLIGYCDPPVEISVRGTEVTARALNDRGRVLLPALRAALAGALELVPAGAGTVRGRSRPAPEVFAEEDRTRNAGAFAAVRALLGAFAPVGGPAPADPLLGLYGAFGYDLIFQVDPLPRRQDRAAGDRDLVLHLPDEIWELDLRTDQAVRHRYEFGGAAGRTDGLPRTTPARAFVPAEPAEYRDHPPGGYARVVAEAMPLFRSGDLFEVVPSQVFRRPCHRSPAALFRRLREVNPAPHSLFMNLGDGEYLVGASPEMFVRVRREPGHGADGHGTDGYGARGHGADGPGGPGTHVPGADRLVVESSPISGTIARGRDALEDARRVSELLGSVKEESELTMCTDVDRNDKSRVCVPGSVQVVERRRIEMYSALIHTVDRVRGVLRPDCDALDGFLAHLWAVTVTGAPKLAAVDFIERQERSPRRWYGGAVGRLGFDGTLETVLTLRTIQIAHGVATVRAGATLLHDSSPAAEEAETELKAKALLSVLDERPGAAGATAPRVDRDRRRGAHRRPGTGPGAGLRVLMVDHRDSFAHCLADYLRQTGAAVTTFRSGSHLPVLRRERPDLVVLSPGPGRPADFGVAQTLAEAERLGCAVFGVCLGLQGMVEYCGGALEVLDRPVHGKPSAIRVTAPDSRLLTGLPERFEVGRYHSLYAPVDAVPERLRVTAATGDGVVMAVEHRELPWAAVQFHPESIMSAQSGTGRRLVENAVAALRPALAHGAAR
ncbi:chorismate-binding protein [Streptomyces sp. NPDC089919]|uniref:chorismate-binding protein n=1 Tax=Streptomyces sp. NPDC089919 TaxID=3155188 RepID=UPI00341A94F9